MRQVCRSAGGEQDNGQGALVVPQSKTNMQMVGGTARQWLDAFTAPQHETVMETGRGTTGEWPRASKSSTE